MAWEFESDRPIYAQLIEQIKLRIISGVYKLGEKLRSVRELAAEAAVNPNTMQKALAELEQVGLLYSQRTSGRYVTEDEIMVKEVKEAMALEQIKEFLKKMHDLGFDIEETVSIIEKVKGDELK